MTAAFTAFVARGGGRINYRLMVEGWPYEWVTSAVVTHETGRDGREVVPGLSYSGLRLRERVIMQEGRLNVSGMTFRIAPTKRVSSPRNDIGTLMFTRYPEPVAQLADSVTAESGFGGLVGGGSLENATVYHLGTEAVRTGTFPAATRHIWDTQPQAHNTTRNDRTRSVFVYEHPPTMEGRRCALYAYANGEDMAGDGQVIWRGVIAGPPRLDSDGLTWLLDAEGVTHVLKQKIAGGIAIAHPVGIYHHSLCAFVVRFAVGSGTWSRLESYSGFDATEAAFIANATAMLQAFAVTELELVDDIRLERGVESGAWRIGIRTGSSVSAFQMQAGSPIVGTTHVGGGYARWLSASSARVDGLTTTLAANTSYIIELVPGNQSANEFNFNVGEPGVTLDARSIVCAPLGPANETMAGPRYGLHDTFIDPGSTLVDNRIYVDGDFTGIGAVHIEDSLFPGVDTFEVTDTGVIGGVNYIEIDIPRGRLPARAVLGLPTGAPFGGYLTSDSEIVAIRDYTAQGSVVDFMDDVIAQSVDANDGDTPFVTDVDIATWELTGDTGRSAIVYSRTYRFVRALALDTLLAEELKLAGHFMRLDSEGKIAIAPVPNFTEVETVTADHQITARTIITPADGYGAWPGWEPQRDGLVTTIEVQQEYDPIEDKWTDSPQTFQNPDAIATHKSRGKALMSIKPYSRLFMDFDPALVPERVRQVAELYLAIYSRDYSTVTLQVSFKHFGILCGDVVSLTHRLIPAGDGTRGVIGRRAVCVERSWELDPVAGATGTLTFQMSNQASRGYAPAVLITSQEQSLDTILTCDPAHAINQAISSNGDGRCLEHFHAGDLIRVVERNTHTPVAISGSIISEPDPVAGTCTVALFDTWTPGTSQWILEYDIAPGLVYATSSQRQFVYVADDGLRTSDERFAERFR